MRPYTKLLAAGLLLLLLGAAPPDPIRQRRHQLILHGILKPLLSAAHSVGTRDHTPAGYTTAQSEYFFVGKFDPQECPDTTLIFQDATARYDNHPTGRYLVQRMGWAYNGTCGHLSAYLQSLWGVDKVGPGLVTRFRQEFGVSPVAAYVPTARGGAWPQWSGPAVLLAFRKYYAGPATAFQQSTYQQLYDLAARDYAREYVALLNHLLIAQRPLWEQLCAQYAQAARTDPKFDGARASAWAVERLFTAAQRARYPSMQAYLYVPVGQLMRRQCDGSLPALVQCLAQVLADYDPAARQQLQVSAAATPPPAR